MIRLKSQCFNHNQNDKKTIKETLFNSCNEVNIIRINSQKPLDNDCVDTSDDYQRVWYILLYLCNNMYVIYNLI